MKSKVSPIIIVVLLVVVIAIGILIFTLLKPSNGNNDIKGGSSSNLAVPVIELALDSSDENQETVTIHIHAMIEDEGGITSITLPDGTEIFAETATYEVSENGNYSFTVNAGNGQTATKVMTVSNIREISATNPYIPEGFSHVEGEVDSGFVIEDELGNQYIWVPVESGKLTRNTMLNTDYEESNSTASALVNSVAQNYGFYIGRYEASEQELDGEKVAASMHGKMPWTGLTYLEASKYANDSAAKFGYGGYNTAILNSYAWDTTLVWIDSTIENYSSNINYGNYTGTVLPTGTTEADMLNNICDLAGNISEWTTEIYKTSTTSNNKNNRNDKEQENVLYRVIRGGSANLSRTPASHRGYPENTSDTYWGFRMILYK